MSNQMATSVIFATLVTSKMLFHKMRYIILIAASIFIWSCNQGFEGTTIEGVFTHADDHLILLEDVATPEKVIVDSTYVKDGKATFNIYINDGVYRLRDQQTNHMVFLYIGKDREELDLTWDLNNTRAYTISGNKESKQLKSIVSYALTNSNEYLLIDSIARKDSLSQEKVAELKSVNRNRMSKFVKAFTDSVKNADVAAFALNYVGATPENITFLVKTSEQIHQKDPEARYAKMWFESMDGYRKQLLSQVKNGLSEGTIAPNFEMMTIKGDTFKLKNLLGQYVLLDFWASWCQPCRKENPNLVEAYKQFKNRKFTIVSVSLDGQRDQWQKGINLDKLVWPYHVSDLLKWRSPLVKTYDIKGIPASFLLDPTGKIIARDLKGNALISTLDQVLPPEMIEVRDSLGNVKLVPKYTEKSKDSIPVTAPKPASSVAVTSSPKPVMQTSTSSPAATAPKPVAPAVTAPKPATTANPVSSPKPAVNTSPASPPKPVTTPPASTPKPATSTPKPEPKPVAPKPEPKPAPTPVEQPFGGQF